MLGSIVRAALFILLIIGSDVTRADALRDYGKYLAGECTTCHRRDGVDVGIPSIIGMDAEVFTKALNRFQADDKSNAIMVSVARSLDKKQIAALAAYFSSLKPEHE